MSSALLKDTWRTSVRNWKRFFSIVVITTLGVAVLTGIYAGCRDMLLSADRFYDAQGLFDIQVVSSAGLTDDDVTALSKVEGVQTVQAEMSASVNTDVAGTSKSATINRIGGQGLNKSYLQEGVLPSKSGQIAVTRQFIVDSGLHIGDTLDVTASDTDSSSGAASAQGEPVFPGSYTITAVVLDPSDIANPEGYSTGAFRSNDAESYAFFVSSSSMEGSLYTAISLRVSDAEQLDTFSDEYSAKVQQVVSRIEDSVAPERQRARERQLTAQVQEAQRQAAEDSVSDATGRSSAEASDESLSIPTVQWHVQNRSSITTYSNLKSDLSSIESIGRAFPVVFLAVAILMSLTAMTRMVEEDRGLIGTYLGLGYGKIAIITRYVGFALAACLLGGVLGNIVGFVGIPVFLMQVLKGLYVIPDVSLSFDPAYGLGGVALFTVGVVVSTLLACRGETSLTPAQLMRPKSPKAGSRVFLERFTWVWGRMSFLNKVTVRNLFRFKSRLLMTVGGIAGCTALIVCGFAINDTVQTLGSKQYSDIDRYDLLSVAASDETAAAMKERLADDGKVKSSVEVRVGSAEMLNAEGNSESIQLIVVPDGQDIAPMVDLRPASQGLGRMFGFAKAPSERPRLTLGDDGILVAQSAANAMGISGDSTVSLRADGLDQQKVKVQAVFRNVIGSDVFISQSLYESSFGVKEAGFVTNAVMATLNGDEDSQISYAQRLAKSSDVASAISTADMERSFAFDLMSAVVALIVALAGCLALVVLFTLASTNVSERVREMATLKVLGFTDREIHLYVNKEMMILTLLGTLLGLPLGRVVGGMLTGVLDMPGMFFEVEINWVSYVISAAATLFFAFIVQFSTNMVLNRIDPVGSLKSVE